MKVKQTTLVQRATFDSGKLALKTLKRNCGIRVLTRRGKEDTFTIE